MDENKVLAIRDINGLKQLRASDFGDVSTGRSLSPEEIDHILGLCDALWLHSGDPSAPHAELTRGMCSDGFVDVLRALSFTNVCRIMGLMMARKARERLDRVDWVIGSDHAAVALSHSVGTWLCARHDSTEKGPGKTQLWNRFTIAPGEVVLQVEELVTSTRTLQAVRNGIRQGNPEKVEFAPLVMTLVHRSKVHEIEGSPIFHLVHYDIKTWDPEVCPLCAAGSRPLRPKQNWRKLTGR